MRYVSTRDSRREHPASLRHAVLNGLAPDGGLYMPERIPPLPSDVLRELPSLALPELGFHLLRPFIESPDAASSTSSAPSADPTSASSAADPVSDATLRRILDETLDFPIPLVPVDGRIHSLELFHGPTLAFKDVGARFMARLMAHYMRGENAELHVIVATSGDTGGAVAAGFHRVPGIRVWILYPKGKVSELQRRQLTTWGDNITALEVDGTFDDCQRIVKDLLADTSLRDRRRLTSANSINIARLLPQAIYHAWAVAQAISLGLTDPASPHVAISVPSGNFGNLTAGLFARAMGIPATRYIAATNANDVVPRFLDSGRYAPRPSVRTLSNAMDVGAPSNFERMQALFHDEPAAFRRVLSGHPFTDAQVVRAIVDLHASHGYLLDPHGAVGYLALLDFLDGQYASGPLAALFMETAHPIKFASETAPLTGLQPPEPPAVRDLMARESHHLSLPPESARVRELLLETH